MIASHWALLLNKCSEVPTGMVNEVEQLILVSNRLDNSYGIRLLAY